MAMKIKKSRYPGIRAFERNERHVFFGRRLEARKLFNMVKAKPLVVLFAKSGIGKSSLINAGVEPLLEQDYFHVVKIRLQSTAISPMESVKNELSSYVDQSKLKKHAKKEGLWEYLKACQFKKGDEEVTPVLVFDQFEEFFEHDNLNQLALTQELADMVSDRLPERIRASLRSIPFRDRTKEQLDWHSPIPVKIVFAIRSDRMSHMDEMSAKIPSILQNRFHLKPLGIEAAREAILEPAAIEGDEFETASFSYSEGAMSTMLEYLKNKKEEIESFQLQLLCRNIERTVERKNAKNYTVSVDDFGGKSGIKSILNNYYEQEITELEESERSLARKFIEEGLIVAGRRVGVSEGVEEQSFGISKDLLSKLLASRLIRAENTHLGRSFELSHDTLVAPILESFEIRRRVEEKAESLKIQKEQELLINAEKKKRNRARLLAVAGFVLFLIAAAGGFYAFQQSRIARAEKQNAVKARDRAKIALAEAEAAQMEMARTNLEVGRANMDNNRFEAAIQNFNTVSELKPNISDSIVQKNDTVFIRAEQLVKEAESLGGIQQVYDNYMNVGNKAIERGEYQIALSSYRKAKDLNISTKANEEATVKILAVSNLLVPKFREQLDKANRFVRANNCDIARPYIKRASDIRKELRRSLFNNAELNLLKELQQKCQ